MLLISHIFFIEEIYVYLTSGFLIILNVSLKNDLRHHLYLVSTIPNFLFLGLSVPPNWNLEQLLPLQLPDCNDPDIKYGLCWSKGCLGNFDTIIFYSVLYSCRKVHLKRFFLHIFNRFKFYFFLKCALKSFISYK